jgi:hypothetical protein
MKLLKGFAVAGVLALAITAPTVASAVVTLDTPSVTVVGNGPSYISLEVLAGASGTPNGFTVEWMPKADYDIYGWGTDYTPPGFNYCTFSGIPTLNVTPGVPDFLLGPSVAVRVVLGELFDETGLYTTYTDEMNAGTQYALRVRAEAGPGYNASANSPTSIVNSGTQEVCRFTLGYWKNHPGNWPVLSLTLGTVTYTQAQLLLILGQPAGGNGLLILEHQLIAAKLNVLLSPPPPAIAADIAAADAMIGGLIPPPIGSDTLPPASVTTLESDLDAFNNGQAGGDRCVTPTVKSTWGKLKSLYR